MKTTTRQLTLCAMLTALALALSWAERFLPLSLLIPLPGIKLGLANIVTLFALYALGAPQAFAILLCRCFLGSAAARWEPFLPGTSTRSSTPSSAALPPC